MEYVQVSYPVPHYNGLSSPFRTSKRAHEDIRKSDLKANGTGDPGRQRFFLAGIAAIQSELGSCPYRFEAPNGRFSLDKGCLKYAINDGDISLIERNGNIAAVELTSAGYKKIGSTLPAQPDLVVPDFIDERRRLQSERVVREGAKQFRDEVLGLWNRRCAITRVGVDEAIEAAHIHRYLGNATNDPRNGIPLRKDVHALFDARKLTLEIKDDTLVVCIGMSLMATPYRKLATRTIQLPMARQFWPSENCLHWHRNTNRKGEPIEKL